MKKMITLKLVVFFSVSIGFISECSTVKGFGQDVSKGGREIQKAAS
ncbi:TPA: entericidin A/B family lipoprotein [Legionella pneumophila]|nr:entericidin A/B family lipoprotein [Legionella pneumophila]TIG84052.1 entericidin [Legionella pneumophila]HAT2159613.1 entericidin A/B family lipoprotein [Legionella pneumophila]HAT8773724.1 entericidin A/B family lipoprotein [Legionella pneumophila]HAU1061146.1 entericidin A/B family lipoprotein [Legionella pneumophila]HAU1232819.1 entericidin A/B family lipoprotein [Legionella pneumophila]